MLHGGEEGIEFLAIFHREEHIQEFILR